MLAFVRALSRRPLSLFGRRHPRRAAAAITCVFVGSSVGITACSSDVPPPGGSGGMPASGGTASGGAASGGTASGGAASGGSESGGAPASGGTGSGGEPLGGATGSGGTASQLPSLLSETGLYMSDMITLAPGVRPFQPDHQLWSDAAEKKRWIALPEGGVIDTSDMDYWEYPTDTRLWKEFVRDGVRVETRLIQKRADRGWNMVAYHWREDQSDADAVPEGLMNASGTDHDIPDTETCKECHTRIPDKVLGFSAIQLSHAAVGLGAGEWTLDQLIAEGKLSDPPAAPFTIPGDDVESDALGYLHANCGHCHQRRSSTWSRVDMSLWLTTEALTTVEETSTYLSIVDQAAKLVAEGAPEPFRIAPQNVTDSAIYQRMNRRGEELAMPPLGTEDKDQPALDLMAEWINSLPVTP